MKYNPEAKRPNYVLPKGEYPAKIMEAEEKTSKAGNPMLQINLEIFDGERSKFVRDYIVLGGEHSQDWKMGHLAKACGMAADGEIVAMNLVERYVRVKVKVKPAKDQYPEDNAVDDYLVAQAADVSGGEPSAVTKPAFSAPESDVPFMRLGEWG